MLSFVQMGIPGAAELLIVVMVLGMMAIPVLAVAGIVVYLLRRNSGGADEERVERLEREVEELRAQTGANDETATDDTADDSAKS